MRDVDGDNRDARLEVARGDLGRDGLVGLELDDEVDVLADEVIGVPKGNPRLIAVVDDNQLDVGARRGGDQAGMDLAGERAVLSLRRIADPVAFAPADLRGHPETELVDLFDEAAVM